MFKAQLRKASDVDSQLESPMEKLYAQCSAYLRLITTTDNKSVSFECTLQTRCPTIWQTNQSWIFNHDWTMDTPISILAKMSTDENENITILAFLQKFTFFTESCMLHIMCNDNVCYLLATSANSSIIMESLLPGAKLSLVLARQTTLRAQFFPAGPPLNLKPALKNLFTMLTSPASTSTSFTKPSEPTRLAIPSSRNKLLVFVSDLLLLDTVCIPITLLSCVWKLLLLFWLFLLLLLLFLLLLLLAITLTALKPAIRKERKPNVLKPPDNTDWLSRVQTTYKEAFIWQWRFGCIG